MIDLYTWQTPNGEKPVIMLEECSTDYELHLIDLSTGAQKTPDFLKINPNGKIPAIVDRDAGGQRVFESGAILMYLAEKTGRFLPASGPERAEALAWTFFQVGNTGPMLGQWHHFAAFADEKIPYAIERYRDESLRVLERPRRSPEAPRLPRGGLFDRRHHQLRLGALGRLRAEGRGRRRNSTR